MAHISYTMSTRGLPDMYTLSSRACGPWASGVHIRQTTPIINLCELYVVTHIICLHYIHVLQLAN